MSEFSMTVGTKKHTSIQPCANAEFDALNGADKWHPVTRGNWHEAFQIAHAIPKPLRRDLNQLQISWQNLETFCCRTCTLSIWRGDSTFPCTMTLASQNEMSFTTWVSLNHPYWLWIGFDSVWFHIAIRLCHTDGFETMRFACAKGTACNACPKSGKIEERNSLHFASMNGCKWTKWTHWI